MKNKARPANQLNNIQRQECPADKAKRLLEKLKSPHLHLASQHLTKNPKTHHSASLRARQMAEEVETLSRGRFTLARNQQLNVDNWTRSTRLKMVHIGCQRESWVSLAQLEVFGGTEKCCCYCSEPLSLDHISADFDLSSIQRFVEIRSGGKVRFSDKNSIEGFDIRDVFLFECLAPCRRLEYDLPFIWFLRDSKPGNSREDTCGCPCCTARQKTKN